ncbi:Oidioi.mRNA.OKI2018_I69.chr2.g7316.t1.cds [Oikopleura dioica]|uniref:Elongation of very long chain fatty acids protein n=1 Tax=Oikopleura dioica TaxID=34765 RepID=A0ABN7TAI0_OIKDI|nr:Oidioi.mRNA.OKI2018_I69.chr2.g7316.t1.cds [Oikopleura dioica]
MEQVQAIYQDISERLTYCMTGWKPKHPFDFFDLRRFEFMKDSYKGFDHFWWFEDHRYAMMSSLAYLLPYNFALVAFNAYIFFEFLASGWATTYNLGCVNAKPYSYDEQSNRMANASLLYFISKHIEFMDTFLFIVMQKWRNVSTLHIFHHSSMAYATWWTTKFAPTGYGTFGQLLNSFIHVLMYSYYGLAALGKCFIT